MSKSDQNIALLALTFAIWYGTNAAYSVYNSFLKEQFTFPFVIAAAQLVVGLFYVIPLWITGLRQAPSLTFNDIVTLTPIAITNAFGHTLTVAATFQKGGGSFTHVIKASEPVISVIVTFLMFGQVPKPLTALSLLPITYGVAYASTLGMLEHALLYTLLILILI